MARARLWFLGPVEDPESGRRGREAKYAYESLMAQLQVCDDQGRFIPVDEIVLCEGRRQGKPNFAFKGVIDDTMAVLARLEAPRHSDSGHEPPAA